MMTYVEVLKGRGRVLLFLFLEGSACTSPERQSVDLAAAKHLVAQGVLADVSRLERIDDLRDDQLLEIHFAEPVAARPAGIRPFTPELLGASMVTLSYRMAAARAAPDGLRRIGRETVVAVEGLSYEALYGDFDLPRSAAHRSR